MLSGKNISLRLIQEEDIPEMLQLMNDLAHRGDYLGVELHHESKIRNYHSEAGFWENDFGRMLIMNKSNRILGAISFFKGVGDCEGYEIGCQIYRKEDRGKGYATEAIRIFVPIYLNLNPYKDFKYAQLKKI